MAVTLVFTRLAVAAAPTLPLLHDELVQMSELDQAVRHRATQGDFKEWTETDAKNQRRLKQIVDQYGWPTYAMVGQDGASAAWLLAQHADDDELFQKKVLALMEPLVSSGQASGKEYAYLHDRTHSPQRFGTQGTCVSREEWRPFEIEDIAGLAERRRKAGMISMVEYATLMKTVCANIFIAIGNGAETRRTVPVPTP